MGIAHHLVVINIYYVIFKHPLTEHYKSLYIYIYKTIYIAIYIIKPIYITGQIKQSNYLTNHDDRLPNIMKQIFIRNQTRLTFSLDLPPKQQ